MEKEIFETLGVTREEVENTMSKIETGETVILAGTLNLKEAQEGNERLLKKVKKILVGVKKLKEENGEKFVTSETPAVITRKITFNIDNVINLEGFFDVTYQFEKNRDLMYSIPEELSEIYVKSPINGELETLDSCIFSLKKYFKDNNIDINYATNYYENNKNILDSFEVGLKQNLVECLRQNANMDTDHLLISKYGFFMLAYQLQEEGEIGLENLDALNSSINVNNLPYTNYLCSIEELKEKRILPKEEIKKIEEILETV